MKFFDRWKKRSFEEKMDDLSQTVLTENNIKDPKQVEQYVVERLEQMIDITREIEEEKSEYRTVTSYLNDVQKLEDLPEPEKKKIADVAQNVVRTIPGNHEQGTTAQGLPHQQAYGALSAAVQSDSPCLHREENPLLRHQETRRHRLYDQPGGQPQPVHRTNRLVQIRKRGREALQDPHSAPFPWRSAEDSALL